MRQNLAEASTVDPLGFGIGLVMGAIVLACITFSVLRLLGRSRSLSIFGSAVLTSLVCLGMVKLNADVLPDVGTYGLIGTLICLSLAILIDWVMRRRR